MLNRLPAIRVGSGRFFALTALLAVSLCQAAFAQPPSFTWDEIRDKFLLTNPTLQAQAQSIESSRASEITAGLRPNPQFQNDTSSATIGIYQEFEVAGKRPARLESARLGTSIARTDFANARRTLIFHLRQVLCRRPAGQVRSRFRPEESRGLSEGCRSQPPDAPTRDNFSRELSKNRASDAATSDRPI